MLLRRSPTSRAPPLALDPYEQEAEIAAGKFLEHANVHDNIYGTSLASVRKVAAAGAVCILDIDVQVGPGLRGAGFNVRSLGFRV